MQKLLDETGEQTVIQAYLSGLTLEDAGASVGVSKKVAFDLLKRRGIPRRDRKEARFLKTAPADRDDIARRYVAGESSGALAEEYGISRATVADYVRARNGEVREMTQPKKHNLNESAFASPNEEGRYWIGMLFADGCVTERERRGKSLCLSLSGEDRSHVYRLREFLKASAPVEEIENPSSQWPNASPSCRLTVHNRKLIDSLACYGMTPAKSLTARVAILEHDRDFWRGVIDGDGWICRRDDGRPIVGFCGSKDMADQFREFLLRRLDGVATTRAGVNKVSHARDHYRFTATGKFAVETARLLYSGASVALPRKQEKALEIIGNGSQP